MGVKVRIAMCGDVPGGHIHEDVNNLVRECARQAGFDDAGLVRCESPIDMIEAVLHPKGADLYDLLICGVGMPGLSVLDVARDIGSADAAGGAAGATNATGTAGTTGATGTAGTTSVAGSTSAAGVAPSAANATDASSTAPDRQGPQLAPYIPPILALAESADDAYEAQCQGIADFVVGGKQGDRVDGLSSVLTRRLASVFQERKRHLDICNGGTACRIPFSRVVRIETAGHDQVVNVADGSIIRTRKTSSEMFDLLSHDERFYKLGSSSIVNLDWVRCTREGNKSVHMLDGSIVSVPVRLRKTFEEALLSRPL